MHFHIISCHHFTCYYGDESEKQPDGLAFFFVLGPNVNIPLPPSCGVLVSKDFVQVLSFISIEVVLCSHFEALLGNHGGGGSQFLSDDNIIDSLMMQNRKNNFPSLRLTMWYFPPHFPGAVRVLLQSRPGVYWCLFWLCQFQIETHHWMDGSTSY